MDKCSIWVQRILVIIMVTVSVLASFCAGINFAKTEAVSLIMGAGHSVISVLVISKIIQKLAVVEYISKPRVYRVSELQALLDVSYLKLKPVCMAALYTFGLAVVSMAVLLVFQEHGRMSLEELAKMRGFVNRNLAYYALACMVISGFYDSLISVNFKFYIKNKLIKAEDLKCPERRSVC